MTDENRRKMLKFRAWRRGFREMDLLMGSFADATLESLGSEGLDEFERLLEVPVGWELSAYLCVGHAEFIDDTPLLHRSGWQENFQTEWEVR